MPDQIELTAEPVPQSPRNYTAKLSAEQVEVLKAFFHIPESETGEIEGFSATRISSEEMSFFATFRDA